MKDSKCRPTDTCVAEEQGTRSNAPSNDLSISTCLCAGRRPEYSTYTHDIQTAQNFPPLENLQIQHAKQNTQYFLSTDVHHRSSRQRDMQSWTEAG